MQNDKWLIIEAAALGWNVVSKHAAKLGDIKFKPLKSVFPALTCTAQASFRTAAQPTWHDVAGNGFFDRRLERVFFWEQSANLVRGARIWEHAQAKGRRIAMLFWQQSLGESVDVVLTPKPIHKHHGGMIQDCYSQPEDLYSRLCRQIGRPFNLMHYWGPLASRKSTEWITDATMAIMRDASLAVNRVFTYLPHLDYDLQRYGPESAQAARALDTLGGCLKQLIEFAEQHRWRWMIWGDYAMEAVTGAVVFPNRILREAGLFRVRRVRGRAYPDLYNSKALCVADHQIAHIYAKDGRAQADARAVLERADGIAAVLDREAQREMGCAAPSAGDLLVVASPGRWFAYPWWTDRAEEPDYAVHVDIHNKPGYDPCELFFGWPPGSVSREPKRVCGTHGRVGPGMEAAWASSELFDPEPQSLLDLAAALAKRM